LRLVVDSDGGHIGNEAITTTRQRDDVSMLARPLAEYATQGVDGLGEIAVLDDDVRPEVLQQLLLVERLPGVLDEIQQSVENLSSDLQRTTVRAR